MEDTAYINKTIERIDRETRITRNLAKLYSEHAQEIENEAQTLQSIDDKLLEQATRENIEERLKSREEKRQRQLERQNERIAKECEDRKRRRALEILRQECEINQKEALKDEHEEGDTDEVPKKGKKKKGKKDKEAKSSKASEETSKKETGKAKKDDRKGAKKGAHNESVMQSTKESVKNSERSSRMSSKSSPKGSPKGSPEGSPKSSPKDETSLRESNRVSHRGSPRESLKGSHRESLMESCEEAQWPSEEVTPQQASEQIPGFSEEEVNTRVAEIMKTMDEPATPPPAQPKKPWTDERLQDWRKSCYEQSPFKEMREQLDAGKISDVEYYMKVLDIQDKDERDAQAMDEYFINTFMKPEPVTDFESDITSNLSSVDKEKPIIEGIRGQLKFPLTYITQQQYKHKQNEELAVQKNKAEEELERRLRGLQEVKRHMDQAKQAFTCHKKERELRKEMENEVICKRLLQNYGINTENIRAGRDELFVKYKKLQKERLNFEQRQVERRIEILKRLLAEEKRKNKESLSSITKNARVPTKRAQYFKGDDDILPDEAPLHDLDENEEDKNLAKSGRSSNIDDEKIILNYDESEGDKNNITTDKSETNGKKSDEKKTSQTGQSVQGEDTEDTKDNKNDDDDDDDNDKKVKRKKSEEKKTKKSSVNEDNKDDKINKRKKKTEIENVNKTSLLKENRVEREYVKAQDMIFDDLDIFETCEHLDECEDKETSETICLEEKNIGFAWKPSKINFKNFEAGYVYQKKVLITNTSTQWLSCYMQELQLNDNFQIGSFEFSNVFPRRICAGLSFDFTVTFRPTSDSEINGKLIFMVDSDDNMKSQCFFILLQCIPKEFEPKVPKVIPSEIKFQNVPAWGNYQEKILKLVNTSDSVFIATISKSAEIPYTSKLASEDYSDSQTDQKDKQSNSVLSERSQLAKREGDADNEQISREELNSDKKSKKKVKITKRTSSKKATFSYGRKNTEEEMKYIIDGYMECVYDNFRFDPMHYVFIPPNETAIVKVKFGLRQPGEYSDEYNIQFEDSTSKSMFQVKMQVSGNIIPFPLTVEPVVLSFNTCVFDCETYQAHFTVNNSSNLAVKLNSKVPSELQRHAEILPSETYVQPLSRTTFCVRLMPKCDLRGSAQRYYDEELEILDFPALVQPYHKSFGRCPALTVQILAVVTSPHALQLNPSVCNLGVVSTQETVCKVFTLSNKSNAWLNYEFPNTSECIQIQPNYGFGLIGPGEDRKLHLLYSPRVEDIMGNKNIQRCGISGIHTFGLIVTSSASEAGPNANIRRKQLEEEIRKNERESPVRDTIRSIMEHFLEETQSNPNESNTENDTDTRGSMTPKRSSRENEKENSITSNSQDTKRDQIAEMQLSISSSSKTETEENPLNQNLSGILDTSKNDEILNDEESVDSYANDDIQRTDDRLSKNVMYCQSFIVDPLCELSHTKLILPPTPCGSCSLSYFHIRGCNHTSRFDCQCGILSSWEEKVITFEAWFSFQSNNEQLTIEPNCGHFVSGQDVKITAIFKPHLENTVVESEARNIHEQTLLEKKKQAEKEKKEKDAQTAKQKKKDKNKNDKSKKAKYEKKGKKGKKGKKIEDEKDDPEEIENEVDADKDEAIELEKCFDPNDIEIGAEDIMSAEKVLFQNLEPFYVKVKVKCLIETSSIGDSKRERRPEVHRMDIVCPVVKPDIMLLDTSHHLQFGPVALGTRSCRTLQVQNLTQNSISVSTSLLNPVGPFTCPASAKTVAPEHILVLPVTFNPQEDEKRAEFFEISCKGTIIPMKVSGFGVEPQYEISPDFLVYRFDYQKNVGKSTEKCIIEIQNNCDAPLSFKLVEEVVAQSEDVPKTLDVILSITNDIEEQALNMKDDQQEEQIDIEKNGGNKKGKKEKGNKEKKEKKGKKERNEKGKKEKKGRKGMLEREFQPVVKAMKKMDNELNPDELNILSEYGDEPKSVHYKSPFVVLSESGGNELVIPPNEKSSFTIQFSVPEGNADVHLPFPMEGKERRSLSENKPFPDKESNRTKNKQDPIYPDQNEDDASADKRSKTQTEDTTLEVEPLQNQDKEKPKNKYAAKYSLFLGNTINVREYFFTVFPSFKIESDVKNRKTTIRPPKDKDVQ